MDEELSPEAEVDRGTADTAVKPPFVPVCAIGASAGGVTALQELFRHLPSDLGLAYVVILHLAPDHPSVLPEILAGCTAMPVFKVDDGPLLKRDCVYVIPPDRELVIEGDHVQSRSFTEPRGRRAPIDLFFRSIAAARGDGIAVVLSGAGADGALGARAIKEAGGVVMVQAPSDAGFSGMPQSAVETGAADVIAPLPRLAERLREVALSKEAVRSLDMDGAANELRRIVAFLRSRTGHDFSGYKRATVMRRVMRRLQVTRKDTLASYIDHLQTDADEAETLFADLLISVTSFFRDPAAFEAFGRQVVQALFDEQDPQDEEGFRVWTVGCATGEEAYSIAMLFIEEAGRRKLSVPIQVFATDLDGNALAVAREGRYPRTIEADVSEQRLARFFIDEGTHYRVRKELRDLVLFAQHSVLKDPPFMRLDAVTCRNLLIYFERALQQQVGAIFHYSLKPNRAMFLGSAETADATTELFAPLDREARLYLARPRAAHSLPVLPQFAHAGQTKHPLPNGPVQPLPSGIHMPTALHAAALERCAPPSALVDDGHAILQLSPQAGRFILHSAGPISNLLPAIVRPELRLDLKIALTRATEQRLPTLTHPATVVFDGERRRVAIHVQPVPNEEHAGATALVLFLDGGPVVAASDEPLDVDSDSDELRRLHGELKAAQEALVVSRLGHEVSMQDLRAANEELQSMNEEYRSTAEELETSKEELQSINEELHTVNAELKSKLDSISRAHSDLQNLTAATEVGTLFLDPDLRIRMFTPPIAVLFNITPVDVGRVITDFTNRLVDEGIARDMRRVLQTLVPVERLVRSMDDRWYVMRFRPYRTVENRVDGTVLTLVDITERYEAEAALSRSEQQLRALVRASSQVLYRMSPTWTEMRELFGGGLLSDTREPSERWLDHYIPPEDHGEIGTAIQRAVEEKKIFELEHRVRRSDGTIGWVQSRAIPLLDGAGIITEWFGSATDVTLRRRAENALRESEERLRVLIEGVPQLIWRAENAGRWTWSSPQWHRYTGLSGAESRDTGWIAAVHPDDRDRVMAAWHEAARTRNFQIECRIGHVETRRYRWFQARATPLLDATGGVVEWLGTSTDVDELRHLQESQAMMVAELQHRTRNLMGVVRSVSEITLRSSGSLDDFAPRFHDRMAALARAQGLLSRLRKPDRVTFDELVSTELAALGPAAGSDRVTMEGPSGVALRSSTVQILAMALHELATNALKYGALAQPNGRLVVRWQLQLPGDGGQPWLQVDWLESGVEMPRDRISESGGAGRELIERALPYQLGARTSFVMAPDGVHCTIGLPVSNRAAMDPGTGGSEKSFLLR